MAGRVCFNSNHSLVSTWRLACYSPNGTISISEWLLPRLAQLFVLVFFFSHWLVRNAAVFPAGPRGIHKGTSEGFFCGLAGAGFTGGDLYDCHFAAAEDADPPPKTAVDGSRVGSGRWLCFCAVPPRVIRGGLRQLMLLPMGNV